VKSRTRTGTRGSEMRSRRASPRADLTRNFADRRREIRELVFTGKLVQKFKKIPETRERFAIPCNPRVRSSKRCLRETREISLRSSRHQTLELLIIMKNHRILVHVERQYMRLENRDRKAAISGQSNGVVE